MSRRGPSASTFLSTPSGWRATLFCLMRSLVRVISIHALRVEGDRVPFFALCSICRFLSTPSGWRATLRRYLLPRIAVISIHALRVEGDDRLSAGSLELPISIHALRVEGDRHSDGKGKHQSDFYPRPPGGGRPTPLGLSIATLYISIHALRVEGDATTTES